jgi:D-glycero-alpha-D-manno-heptose-7-phosphate kinase
MIIRAKAPNRIDLSGGTLDIYPLYVFMDGGCTVNAAIDLYSEVELETREQPGIEIHSRDLDLTLSLSPEELAHGNYDDSVFGLLVQILRFYRPQVGLRVSTRNHAPKGSGLGASSALLIALSGALNQLNKTYYDGETLIRFGADLEARSLGVPTGKQDYYGAMYGGISAIHFETAGIRREELGLSQTFLDTLNRSLIISFTGDSHFSGTNNWNMMKGYIDNIGHTRDHLKQIKTTAYAMREALRDGDFDQVMALINEEWNNRKQLAEGVSTPQIDRMIAGAAAQGALASKICGAGGGGCMITFCEPQHRSAVIQAIEAEGARILPNRIVPHGLTLHTEG